MPMIALDDDGNVSWPDEVKADTFEGICPECSGRLTIRKGHYNNGSWTVRHFWHSARIGTRSESKSASETCSGVSVAESNEHKMMKYVASRNLKQTFSNDGTVKREVEIADTGRIADVVCEFDKKIPRIGNGLIVECQYKNKTKPKLAVTLSYLNAGYSVCWVNERHFSSDWRSVNPPEPTTPWPRMVPRQEKWSGYQPGWQHIRNLKNKRPPYDVKLPAEYQQTIEPKLKNSWKRGSGEYTITVEVELTSNNADRPCEICGDRADWYLLDYGHLSDFRCESHHPASKTGGAA